MEENLDANQTVKPEQSDYSESKGSAAPPSNDKRPPKNTMKRKKIAQNYSQDADENNDNYKLENEAIEQPKKKKKKNHTGSCSHEEKQSVQINSSKHRKINAKEELQPIINTDMKEERVMETKNMPNYSEASETAGQKKKKKKGSKKSSSDMTQINKIKKNATHENKFFQGISDSRLAAYGENPKKIKNKVKYGKQKS